MRDFVGIPYQAIPEPISPEFTPRLKAILANLDYFLRDMGAATRNLDKGLTTTGQSLPPLDLSKYMYLPGRAGGQTLQVFNVADNMFTIAGTTAVTGNMFQVLKGTTPFFETYYNATLTRGEVRIGNDGAFPLSMHSDGSLGYVYCDKIAFYAPLASVSYPKSQLFLVDSLQIQLLGRITTRATVSNIGLEMNMANVPDLSDTSVGVMVSQHSGSQSGDLMQFTNSNASSVLSRVKSDGTWSGPLDSTVSYTFDDSLFSIFNHTSTTKKIAFSAASITAGNTRTMTIPDSNGTIACINVAQTFTAHPTLDDSGGGNVNFNIPNAGGDSIFAVVDAANGANTLTLLSPSSALSGASTVQLPVGGGTLITAGSTVLMTNKSIQSGTVNLTGQTGDIGTTNITITPSSVAAYLVEVIALCTTNDATAGALTVTIGWTDNVGATTANVASNVGTFPLTLTATGRASGSVFLRRASGNITYATTHTGTYGTAQYALYIRVLGMGL